MREFLVLGHLSKLFPSVDNLRNKGWVRRVPAAAVIPAAQVVVDFIESKTFVAGPLNPWVNREAQLSDFRGDWRTWDRERPEVLLG